MDARDTLLLACGTSNSRAALRSLLENDFNLLEANNSRQARLFLDQNAGCIAAMILDISASETVDISLLRDFGKTTQLKDIPVVVIADRYKHDIVAGVFDHGATDVYSPNYNPLVLRHRIHNIVELYRHKWHLQDLVEEQAATLRHSNDAMVDVLSSIIEYRSLESGQHIRRIRGFTRILLEELARSCPEYGLTEDTIQIISSASALHDIGKISVPDSILNKPGKLTREECAVMKTHSTIGSQIVESLADIANQEYLRYAHNICHYHHERWDGNGYPEGLAGDNIPICAQVVGLADAYDALTNNRVYKKAFSFEKSVNMILNGECGVFSPKLLECFKLVTGKFKDLAQAYADGLSPQAEKFDVELPPPSPQEDSGSLHSIQTKYQSMLHYAQALVLEVDLDHQQFHLVYNPDPNLTLFRPNSTFPEMEQMLSEQLIFAEDRDAFHELLHNGIPRFLAGGFQRQSHTLRIYNQNHDSAIPYTITLLRLDPNDLSRKRFLVIWQNAANFSRRAQSPAENYASLFSLCCFHNDLHFTLADDGSALSFLLGYTPEELKTSFHNHLSELVIPQDRELLRQRFNEQLAIGNEVQLTYRLRHKNNFNVWVLHKCRIGLGADGMEYLYSTLIDVTRAKNAQEHQRLTLEQYEQILSRTGNIVFDLDVESDTLVCSNTWEEIFGYTPMKDHVSSRLATESHFHPDDIPGFLQCIQSLKRGSPFQMIEIRIANAEGRYIWCRFRGVSSFDEHGNATRILGIIVNINEDKIATRALQEQAEQDSLTKLLNKEAARKYAESYLQANPDSANCTMLILDLDNFKQVNDQLGHMFGDSVLTAVSKELKKFFRYQDIVARIGGDEFMILMHGTSDQNLVQQRCERLLSIFTSLFEDQLADCNLSCSIGVAFAPLHGTTYSTLFQCADQALYQAKRLGKNRYELYDMENPAYHIPQQMAVTANTRIDSEEQPDLTVGHIVQHALRQLYTSSDKKTAVNNILALMGEQSNVSRVYVFENSPDNRYCSNTYEWCNEGIPPEIDNLQNISYETDIPNYEDNFDEYGIFYCPDVEEQPQHIRDILEPQGIKSLVHCAIRDNGVFRGYIGFDDCSTKRFWTKDQIQTLTLFSEMLGSFLLKEQAQAENLKRMEDLTSVLDNQQSWIYVIDPDTCKLHFLNAKTRALAPNAEVGMTCHQSLMGKSERCPDCPALHIREKKNCSLNIINEHLGLHVHSDATLIRWGGKDACLLSCREVDK